MNLRQIANGITTAINPNIQAVYKSNDGYTVNDAGEQVPNFTQEELTIQPQSLATEDLQHLNLANQQGQFIYAYANGRISALRRAKGTGNDVLTFTPYGEDEPVDWIVKQVVESYPDWVKVLLWRKT